MECERFETIGRRVAEAPINGLVHSEDTAVISPTELQEAIERIDAMEIKAEGPRIIARCWVDPAFKAKVLADASSAVAELGIGGSNSAYTTKLTAVENTESVHNVIVCTLCSCYPLSILGLSPPYYKSR